MAVADPRIPSRDTVARRYLSATVDPGNVAGQRVPVPVGYSFRYPGFGRDPELGQAPLDVTTSSSFNEQPKTSPSLYNVYAGGGNPGGESDGNVGQNSPTTGPDADSEEGIGGLGLDVGTAVQAAGTVVGMVNPVAGMVIGLLGRAIGMGSNQTNPTDAMNNAISATAQSQTQTQNPGSVQSPGDEGAAATAAASTAAANAAAANAGGGAVGNDGIGSSDGGSVGDATSTGTGTGTGTGGGGGGDGSGNTGTDGGGAATGGAADAGSGDSAGTYHQGGMIPGAEDGYAEDAPITAQEGEFVLQGAAVAELGPDAVDMLNRLPQLDFNERQNLLGMISERIMGGGAMDLDGDEYAGGGTMPSNMPGPAAMSTMGGMPPATRPPVPPMPGQQMPRRPLDNVWAA